MQSTMIENKGETDVSVRSMGDDTVSLSRAKELVAGRSWIQVPHLLNLNFCIFLVTLTSTNTGYDSSMLNGFQSLTDTWVKQMGYPSGAILGALSNGNIFGVAASFLVASYLSDKYGRWPCVVGGQIIVFIGSMLQGASTGYAFFLVSRIILGFGSGIAAISGPTLISEIAYPTHREVTTASYNTCWYLGAIIAAWVTYGTRTIDNNNSWRIPSYLQGFLPFVQLLLFWMVPESPRYYVSKGNEEKAQRILMKYHIGYSNDEKAIEFVQFEMNEIRAALELEKLNSSSRYIDFFKNRKFRKRLFLILMTAVLMQFSGNGLVSFYLTKVLISIGITGQKMQLKINGCLMIYNWVIAIGLAAVTNKFKRRLVFLSSISMMLILYVIWTVLSAINQERNFNDKSLAQGVLAMIFLYYFGYNIGANGFPYLYVTEILPYSHRTKGLNIFQIMQEFIVIFNGFVNPIGMQNIEWRYYIVYCCILALELVIFYLFFVETSGYTLEEVARAFGEIPEDTSLEATLSQKTAQAKDSEDV